LAPNGDDPAWRRLGSLATFLGGSMRLDTSNKPRDWTGQLQYNALRLTLLVCHSGAAHEAAEFPAQRIIPYEYILL